jgi:hypothetical protein
MATIGEQLYLAQKIRDTNNPGCIEYRKSMELREKYFPKTKKQNQLLEEYAKKMEEGEKAGYESKRFDFPQYQWKFQQDGKTYLRSSCNNNVYDYSSSSSIVGTWNQVTQRIELNNELTERIKILEETVFKLRLRLEELHSE